MYSCEHGRQKTPCAECDRERDQLRAELEGAQRCVEDLNDGCLKLEADLAAERRAHEQIKRELDAMNDNFNYAREAEKAARAALQAANERAEAAERRAKELEDTNLYNPCECPACRRTAREAAKTGAGE